jgi:hypothetical protein
MTVTRIALMQKEGINHVMVVNGNDGNAEPQMRNMRRRSIMSRRSSRDTAEDW